MAMQPQTVTETQVVAALQGIGKVLQQMVAELAAIRASLEGRK